MSDGVRDDPCVTSRPSSAFYLFRLPECWKPFLCFNSKQDGRDLGLVPGVTYVPCCSVLPMGWSSSVGLMQMASRELIRRNTLFGATKLRKQALARPCFGRSIWTTTWPRRLGLKPAQVTNPEPCIGKLLAFGPMKVYCERSQSMCMVVKRRSSWGWL